MTTYPEQNSDYMMFCTKSVQRLQTRAKYQGKKWFSCISLSAGPMTPRSFFEDSSGSQSSPTRAQYFKQTSPGEISRIGILWYKIVSNYQQHVADKRITNPEKNLGVISNNTKTLYVGSSSRKLPLTATLS